jgi:hypothetical protein
VIDEKRKNQNFRMVALLLFLVGIVSVVAECPRVSGFGFEQRFLPSDYNETSFVTALEGAYCVTDSLQWCAQAITSSPKSLTYQTCQQTMETNPVYSCDSPQGFNSQVSCEC